MTVALKQNVAGYTDELGRFRPIRSPEYVGGRTATRKDKRKYSPAKAGDLGKAKQERALEDVFDREIRLKKEAAERKARDEKRIMAEIEGDIYGGESRGKGYSLLQFVRNAGGFRRQFRFGGKKAFGKRSQWDGGEIDRLSYKETGKRGLTTDQPNKGKTPDKMYQAALAEGFEVSSISDLIERVEAEAAGHGATYSTHGYMNYTERENPKDNRHGYEIYSGGRRLQTVLHSDRRVALKIAKQFGSDTTIRRVDLDKQRRQSWRGRITGSQRVKAGPQKLNPEKVDWGMRVCANCDKYVPNKELTKLGAINVCKPCHKKLTARTAAKSQQSLFDDQGNLFNPMTNPDSKAIANTILQQLGGNKFVAMTGAKTFMSHGNGLSFKLPSNFATDGINYVKIMLTSSDLYDIDWGKIRGLKYTVLRVDKGVYGDMLRDLFTRRTGLDTSLGTMGRKNPIRVLLHKFYPGQKLSTRSIGDHDTIYRAEVVSRTPKMVTFKEEGYREIKKAKIHRMDNTEYFYPHGKYSMASIFTAEKGQRANPKKNPDAVSIFASLAGGVASALSIHDRLSRPTRRKATKKRGTTTAKRRNPMRNAQRAMQNAKPKAKNRNRNLYALTIGSGDDIFSVLLKDKDGDGYSKEFKTMASAKAYATRNKHKVEWNPKGTRRTNPKISKAEAKRLAIAGGVNFNADVDTHNFSELNLLAELAKKAGYRKPKNANGSTGRYFFAHLQRVRNPTPKKNGIISRALARRKAASEYKKELRLEAAAERSRHRRRKAEAKAKGNPVSSKQKAVSRKTNSLSLTANRPQRHSQRRPAYEAFQGRPSEKVYTEVPISNHAPAKLDQLGDLIELKIAGGPTLKFNGKGVRLCAAGGKLWIAGKRFAKPNPGTAANVVNPIGEIDHVVYGTSKPHHGDHAYTHYIHKLGEESGKRPILCVDREGYPVIRGGNYKIEPRGIVD